MGQEDASGDTRGKCVSLQALAMDGPDRIKIRFPSSSAVQFQLACFRNWVSEGRYYNFFCPAGNNQREWVFDVIAMQ